LEIPQNLWRISINLDEQDCYRPHNDNEKRNNGERKKVKNDEGEE
jgi:hypothetical protein